MVDQITRWNGPVRNHARNREKLQQTPLEFSWRVPSSAAESRTERSQTLIADSKADIRPRRRVADKQLFGAIDPQPRKEFQRSLAEGLRKQPVVVKRRKVRFAGRIGKAQRLIQIGRNVIPGAAEPDEEIVIDLRPEAMRRCVDQRMRHKIILRHNPALPIELQPLAAPLNRRPE